MRPYFIQLLRSFILRLLPLGSFCMRSLAGGLALPSLPLHSPFTQTSVISSLEMRRLKIALPGSPDDAQLEMAALGFELRSLQFACLFIHSTYTRTTSCGPDIIPW